MFQKEFIKLLIQTASTTMKDISGCEVRPPFQGGKTTGRGFAGPWVAGSDETGALDPRLLSFAAPRRMAAKPRTEHSALVATENSTRSLWRIHRGLCVEFVHKASFMPAAPKSPR
jgi:hypothetical protein